MSVSTCDLQAQINALYSRIAVLENIVEGEVALVGGAASVPLPAVTVDTIVIFSRHTAGGTLGHVHYSITPGVGINFLSTDPSETSTLTYRVY